MKKVFLIIAILFVALVIYLNYDAHFSSEARQKKANLENLKKVKIGMTKAEVLKVMGKPDYSDSSNINSIAADLGKSRYNYKISGTSYSADIQFDYNNKVINIYK